MRLHLCEVPAKAGSRAWLVWEAEGAEEPLSKAHGKRHHSETRGNPNDGLNSATGQRLINATYNRRGSRSENEFRYRVR